MFYGKRHELTFILFKAAQLNEEFYESFPNEEGIVTYVTNLPMGTIKHAFSHDLLTFEDENQKSKFCDSFCVPALDLGKLNDILHTKDNRKMKLQIAYLPPFDVFINGVTHTVKGKGMMEGPLTPMTDKKLKKNKEFRTAFVQKMSEEMEVFDGVDGVTEVRVHATCVTHVSIHISNINPFLN